MKTSLTILLLATLTGCANFEYDITRPEQFARHLGKTEEIFAREPLEYRCQTVDSRLIILIYNTSDTPINLLGDRSSVVDQKGQSHPLRSVTIAPRSFVKLVMPPLRPQIERTGPSIGIGFGVIGSARHRRYPAGPVDYEPRYLTIYDDDGVYWDWTGETDVRITFVYQQGQPTFSHEFVIARKKV